MLFTTLFYDVYTKDLFFTMLTGIPFGENCLVDMGTSYVLNLIWGLFVNGVIFSKTHVQYTSYPILLPKSHVRELRLRTWFIKIIVQYETTYMIERYSLCSTIYEKNIVCIR